MQILWQNLQIYKGYVIIIRIKTAPFPLGLPERVKEKGGKTQGGIVWQ